MNAERIDQIKTANSLSDLVKDFGVVLKSTTWKVPFL